ncbi:molybdopterin molybdotransferase MoeA [Nitratifractor sp.]
MTRTYEEAKATLLESVTPGTPETITLDEALGRVLAQGVVARFDIPEAAKCAIDGYTFAFDSIQEYPATLKIIGESRAGGATPPAVGPQEAVFTMTGALVPQGADTAVRIEDVKVEGDRVTIFNAPKKGDLINPKGDEVTKGQEVLRPGTLLDAKTVALLANLGYYQVQVFPKVRIGIVVTGDEVREPWEGPGSAGVRNSNYYILKGLLAPFAQIRYYGIVQDEPERMIPLFDKALNENDLLLSSGGASKGKYDFTKTIAEALKLTIHFTHTDIRPGRPLIFGTRDDQRFWGLPGYPAALMANALAFLLPPVRKAAGLSDYENRTLTAVAEEPLRSKTGRIDFVRVRLHSDAGRLYAKSAGSQQTSNFLTLAQSDALAMIDAERGSVEAGEIVTVWPL